MGFKMTSLVLLAALAIWLPVLWGYLYGRWRRLVNPGRFALTAACASVGLHVLATSSFGLIARYLLPGWLVRGCDGPGIVCAIAEFLAQWLPIGLLALLVLAGPWLIERYIWRK